MDFATSDFTVHLASLAVYFLWRQFKCKQNCQHSDNSECPAGHGSTRTGAMAPSFSLSAASLSEAGAQTALRSSAASFSRIACTGCSGEAPAPAAAVLRPSPPRPRNELSARIRNKRAITRPRRSLYTPTRADSEPPPHAFGGVARGGLPIPSGRRVGAARPINGHALSSRRSVFTRSLACLTTLRR
ncbi:hypothetical protein EVAR_5930_1 [Eumeta japonica]|uniref:Uncharacterized protein n=1 Tax=Eumeta variegata TaxID=151549 RepID=A0A4C1TD23_EUMVA|nr:hypothetical protein EVAR_5930_1 [Eumeta japonica]